MIYKLILALRNLRYRGGAHTVKADVPTVCVGNITAGGTGKTPHTELILSHILGRGTKNSPAVLSRGYKRKSKGFRIVEAGSTSALCGDEPLQIKRKFPAVTVAVDKDRVRGCRILAHPEEASGLRKYTAPEFPAADLIILDDAYQYRRLKADLDIVLTPFSRPVSKDSLLPAGRLRDLKSRLYTADAVIVTKCPYELGPEEKAEHAALLGFSSYDAASCTARRGGRSLTLLFSLLAYGRPEPVFPEADSRYTYSSKVVLVTGIADDKPLLDQLSGRYHIVSHLTFPDHHAYSSRDIKSLVLHMRRNPTAAFFTTEKDATRLRDLPDFPQEMRKRFFYIPITVDFPVPGEREALETLIDKL